MRRALHIGRVMVVYLLLGLVTTWAVAWGLAVFVPVGTLREIELLSKPAEPGYKNSVVGSMWYGTGSAATHYTTKRRSHDYPRMDTSYAPEFTTDLFDPIFVRAPKVGDEILLTFDVTRGAGWGMRHIAANEGPESQWASAIDDARGFPVLALWCSRQAVEPPGRGPFTFPSLAGGIDLPLRDPTYVKTGRNLRALPYYPIWSGLALNTAFYALLFFAVVRITRGLKHARRYRRGLCPRCKYDRLFDYRVPCPECGHEVRVRRALAAA